MNTDRDRVDKVEEGFDNNDKRPGMPLHETGEHEEPSLSQSLCERFRSVDWDDVLEIQFKSPGQNRIL